MYKISEKAINLIKKAIEKWKVELTAGRQTLVVVKIQKGIFHEDFRLCDLLWL